MQAAALSDKELIVCIDHLILTRRTTLTALDHFAQKSGHLAGLPRLKALLANLGSQAVDSHAERRLLHVITSAGLPEPVTQFTLRSQPPERRFIARLDFAWPAHRLALELDGKQHHGLARFDSDRERGNEIEAAGWRLLRTSPSSATTRPDRLLRALRSLLAAIDDEPVSRSG
jgi:very-short-patch-repair endonuclease